MRNIYILLALLTGPMAFGQTVNLNHVSSFSTGIFDEGASEILSYHSGNQTIYFSNADANSIGRLDISNPAQPSLLGYIDCSPYGGGVNSVVAASNFIAVAVEDTLKQNPGFIVFFDLNGNYLNQVQVGALPDMVGVNSTETFLVSANEGEPSDDYANDPLGSVSIIDLALGVSNLTQAQVTTLDFSSFTAQDLDSSVRIFGNNGQSSIAQDLEPEYIAFHPSLPEAYVVCQENNAVIRFNLLTKSLVSIKGLGFKDHSLPGNGFDASDKDGQIDIQPRPVLGMYQPDAFKSASIAGTPYFFTANEGDARDYDGYSEEERVKDLILDSSSYPNASSLQADANLGRLKTTSANGDVDGDGDFDQIYSYGARSFSIWDENMNLIYDSGDELESILAQEEPSHFNSTNDDNDSFDNRSDDKGPEPEAIEHGSFGGMDLLFVAAERHGGLFMFDVSNPNAPVFLEFENNRNFALPADDSNAGDLGPEDIVFVSGNDSPVLGTPMVLVANEVSGTISLFELSQVLGLDEAEVELAVYPNPAQDFLMINARGWVEIITNQGQVVKQTYTQDGRIDVQDLPSGFYMVRTKTGKPSRFVKQ